MREISSRVRFVVASGFVDPALRDEMTKAGARIVQKPYETTEVLRTIRTMLDS
jgi:hypothetical protein